jgi:predicted  nucleic acid-binding Zn-ribbon protein
MDVNLQNVYADVLLDNFIAVIKQNIMFQAQIEIMTKSLSEFDKLKKEKLEFEKNYSNLKEQFDRLSGEFNVAKTTVSQTENLAISSNNLKADKDRLQSAVNDYMKQVKRLENQISDIKKSQEEQDKYISKLESVIPATKLKKLKTVDLTEFEQTEQTIVDDVTKNGGTF